MNYTSVEIKFIDKPLYHVRDEVIAASGMLKMMPPRYQTPGAAAVDLLSTRDVCVRPGETEEIGTGIAISILNEACCAVILPRSGMGKKGLVLANLVGLIDSDYQGELKVLAWNRNPIVYDSATSNARHEPIYIKRGDRIAQLLFLPVLHAQWNIVDEFSVETERGEGGIGSTGGFLTAGQVKAEIEKRK